MDLSKSAAGLLVEMVENIEQKNDKCKICLKGGLLQSGYVSLENIEKIHNVIIVEDMKY